MTSRSKLFIGLQTLFSWAASTQHSTACRDHCTVTTQHDDILIPVETASVDFLNSTTTQVETAKLATCCCIGSMSGICCVWFIAHCRCIVCFVDITVMWSTLLTRIWQWVIESQSSTAKPDHLNIKCLLSLFNRQSLWAELAYQCSWRAVDVNISILISSIYARVNIIFL